MAPTKRPAADDPAAGPSKVPRQDDGAQPSTTSPAATLLTFLCHMCNVTFTRAWDLTRHCKTQHGDSEYICKVCDKAFAQKGNLTRHLKVHVAHTCSTCDEVFSRKVDLTRHRKTHMVKPNQPTPIALAMPGDPSTSTDPRNPASATCPPKGCKTALKGSLERHRVDGTEDDIDLPAFLRAQPHAELLKDALKRKKGLKFFISVNMIMVRPKNWITRGDPESRPYFTSRCGRVLEATDIDELLEVAYEKIINNMADYLREGSGWIIGHINFVDLNISTYKPLKGSSYIPLPTKIAHTKGVINVQNEDNKCFLWSVLSALHPAAENPHRLCHYQPFEDSLNVGNLTFPISPNDIPKFEKMNGLAINLFGHDEEEEKKELKRGGLGIFPIHISKLTTPPINLLLISNGTTQHYCWIKDFNKLMHSNVKSRHRAFYCLYCLHRFSAQHHLDHHAESCRQHGPQKIRLPEWKDSFMKFDHPSRALPVPYTIYVDFESTIVPMEEQAGLKTERTAEHRPASVCYVVVGPDGELTKPPFLYRGEDCVKVFLDRMKEEEEEIKELKELNLPMNLTDEEEASFQTATTCHICTKPLNGDSHRDHDHLTGEYRGAAHPGCNVNFMQRDFIPVVLHNLRGYDSHLIMQKIGEYKDSKIDCLANNFEKYISFTFRSLRFIDSLQFMNESLDKLVNNLAKSGQENFKLTQASFHTDKLKYVLAKGHFPYEYFDSLARLEEPALPPQAVFHSTLTNTDISNEDYAHAQEVWSAFSMQNFGDYHDLYLKTDVLLLADVFQNFRSVCLKCYGLDPCHYYTSPGLAWDAALKKSGVTLELLTDPDMYLFVEEGTRGGISMISNRYAEANNTSLPNYDSTKASSHIAYLDANNLYGWAMSQHLPVGGFQWVDGTHPIDISQSKDDDDTGYILEVDLEYPRDLHDQHSDYPLAPERMVVTEDMLSPYSKRLLETHGTKHSAKVEKLVPNLRNKSKYILHIRNLKFYMEHGMKLTKIHRALKFRQAPWLKSYIDFNTAQRALAKTEFEKNFFKLMNNAVFGKTMENLRKRRNIKLVHNQDRYEKLVAQPGFESCRRFSEDLVGVEMAKTSLYLNRPIYVGFTVLDLSKILMYQFYYDVLKVKYGEKVKLLFTDTDSLLVQVFTEDLHTDMTGFTDLLDTSDYPSDHFLYSTANKKVIGKFKDELNSIPIISYVGLRAKMYSIKPLHGADKKTAKGVSKSVVRDDFRHADYKKVLFEGSTKTADMAGIRSHNHRIYTLEISKLGLSAADDKRYVLPNGFDTLAHGHYRAVVEMDCV